MLKEVEHRSVVGGSPSSQSSIQSIDATCKGESDFIQPNANYVERELASAIPLTPEEIEYFIAVGERLDKAGSELRNDHPKDSEEFKAGTYACLRAHDLFSIPEVATERQRRMKQIVNELYGSHAA